MTKNEILRMPEFPNDADGNSLRSLMEHGSDVYKEMEIDFSLLVPNENAGVQFATYVRDYGFRPSVTYDEKHNCWTCNCSKTMIPLYDSLIREQAWLAEAGAKFGAKNDGWGTFGNAP